MFFQTAGHSAAIAAVAAAFWLELFQAFFGMI
jgi:hypothetical protein